MYRLMVSYTAGYTYNTEAQDEKFEELLPKGEELDQRGLRWKIVDQEGHIVKVSAIHHDVDAFMRSVRGEEPE